ncbi:SIS domain-containing protein [Oribacterium parvum]|uniref:D-sedoheptulose-7-phosphate isomerase n=1 Tax=Oribacterium parvum TaxID=1501329 RepID=UPI0028EF8FCC|nr:SIS domain-containing protein [Oribacterium parvum]
MNIQEEKAYKELAILEDRYPVLKAVHNEVWEAFSMMRDSFLKGGKLLLCGNGGSAADSDHIVGELMKSFCAKRKIKPELQSRLQELYGEEAEYFTKHLEQGLPAISFSSQTALHTAFSNDQDEALFYAQCLLGYGKKEDVLFGISTSGNAKNVGYALKLAKAMGIPSILLTGKDGGTGKDLADLSIIVPSGETYQIQELHLPIYHSLCLMLEQYFFG